MVCSFPSKPNEPARAWITNVFLPLLEAPYPMQRREACRENTSLPANNAANSQYKPLCVPSALTERDAGNFLPRATTGLTLQHPTIPRMAPIHVLSTWIPCQHLVQGFGQNKQGILFTGGLVCPIPNFLGT